MHSNITTIALKWSTGNISEIPQLDPELYCSTRDVFQARLDTMTSLFLQNHMVSEDLIFLIVATAGEIGNNSFDHNLGSWPDIPGIFFGYQQTQTLTQVVLADRGQGIFKTLQRVKPSLQDDQQALLVAFKEKLSGRAPESRGNGLKFVRETVQSQNLHLTFYSGSAKANLNQTMQITAHDECIKGCLAILEFSGTM